MLPRNQTLDIMKGIGITLVVLGHAIQKNLPNFEDNFLFRAIYTFHMPLFFLISGYLMYQTLRGSRLQWLKNKAIYLLIPHFLFNIIYYPMSATGLTVYPDWTELFSFSTWMVYSSSLNMGDWFLWSLFHCLCMLLLVDWIDRKCSNKVFWFSVVALIFLLGAINLNTPMDWFLIHEFKFFGPFTIFGYLIARHKNLLRKYLIPTCILGAFSFLILITHDNAFERPQIDLLAYITQGGLDFYAIKYLQGLCGISLVLLIAKGINKIKGLSKVFAWLGTASLGIYLFSACFPGVAVGAGLIRVLSGFGFSLLLAIVLSTICYRVKICGILLGDISFFRERPLKWLNPALLTSQHPKRL